MQLLVSYVSGTIGGYGRPVSTLQGTNYYSNTSGLPGIKPKRISKGTGISYMHGLSKTTRVLSILVDITEILLLAVVYRYF